MAKPAVQTFGKYQILERIATGGMAEIYKARLEGIGGFQRIFAIKRILPHLSQNAEYVAMLVDEAKVAGLLSHANIVQILDLGQVDGVWYIAMEYVEGRDLGNVLRKARDKGLCLPVPHTVFITIELLKGLEYAHQRQVMRGGRPVPLNIIHRDISPPNILLSFQGEVKLTDFGIARASHKALETQSGIIKGRFDYMSPEQAAGAKDLDQRSDLFTVGVVLYETITGEHPFRSESELGTLDKIRSGRYTPLSAKNPDVPFTLETIIDRALRVDRNERYPTATAFKEALDKFFHDSGFIFTHSTLAAYVRGLYPEGRGGQAPKSLPPAPILQEVSNAGSETDDIDIELELEGEGPTRVMESRTAAFDLERPARAEPPPPALVSSPGLSTGDLAGANLASEWADEQETQIRPSPFTPAPVSRSVEPATPVPPAPAPPSVPTEPPAHRMDRTDRVERIERPARPERADRYEAPPARRGVGLLGGVVATMTFGVGLLVGAATAALALQLLGAGPAAVIEAPARPPLLRIDAPAGAVVQVNEQPWAADSTVAPNQPQRVRVSLQGHAPWEQTLTLVPGEIRVVVIETAALEAASP